MSSMLLSDLSAKKGKGFTPTFVDRLHKYFTADFFIFFFTSAIAVFRVK